MTMFKKIELLSAGEVSQLTDIAKSAQFVDGKISNPYSKVKNNQQLHDAVAYQQSSKILVDALSTNAEFNEFAFPARFAPPLMTRHTAGMHYGLHPDSANINLPEGPLRSDLSCTIFLSAPDSYDGGALHIKLENGDLRFKENAGTAIVYPSSTLHEVETVISGERLVAITFIQSRIADIFKRDLVYQLNEVAALEGNNMSQENYARMQLVQFNLLRMWQS